MSPARRVRPKINAVMRAISAGRVRAAADATAPDCADGPFPCDNGKLAEEIGVVALELAKRANTAGLTNLGFLLETVALEAGAEAVARRWPAETAER